MSDEAETVPPKQLLDIEYSKLCTQMGDLVAQRAQHVAKAEELQQRIDQLRAQAIGIRQLAPLFVAKEK